MFGASSEGISCICPTGIGEEGTVKVEEALGAVGVRRTEETCGVVKLFSRPYVSEIVPGVVAKADAGRGIKEPDVDKSWLTEVIEAVVGLRMASPEASSLP